MRKIYSVWGSGLLFLIVIGALFYKSLFFGLTYLDDQVWTLDYQWFLVNWLNAVKFFTKPDFISPCFYRPFLDLSFMIEAHLGHFQIWVYHFTNILLHFLGTCFAYKFFEHFLKDKKPALILALVFAVHPVLSLAAAWIPGRTDSILAVFALPAFLCFVNYLDQRKKILWIGYVLLTAGAFLCKETALVLPVMCILYLLIYKKEWGFKNYTGLWIFWGLGITGFLILRKSILALPASTISWDRLFTSFFQNLPTLILGWGKAFFPVNVSVLPTLGDSSLGIGIAALTVMIVLLLVTKQKVWPNIIFGGIWFVFFLLPSLILSFIEHEYRLYLSLLGFILILAQTDIFRWSMQGRRVWLWALIIIALAGKSFYHIDHVRNRLEFWKTAVINSPHSPLAHRNLAAMYFLDKDLDRAEVEFKKAADLNFQEPMVHNNLGLIDMNRGRFTEAEKEYLLEIKFNPAYGNAYYNYGLLKFMQKQYADSAKLFEQAVYYDPKHVDAVKMLIQYYHFSNDATRAQYWEEYLRRNGVTLSTN
ncbi:MAG: glycosyltransferase family 39 protein [Candidatus Omnitrophica bacterium]|nr:glycosyltransferase family 39 protein [Candidatus Omnitrophota bacterium]